MDILEEYSNIKHKTTDTVRQWLYYFIIGIISLIALVFLPMIGATIGLGWNLPDTIVGWVVWAAVKIIIATINILIFHSFMCQAKLNIKEDPKYKEANEILGRVKLKKYTPRSPHKWNSQQYGRKGTLIFFTSALTVVALTQALLTFDWMAMLTYLFTIIMGLIFGVLQMKSAEEYWTEEYWKYAKMVEEAASQKEATEQASLAPESTPLEPLAEVIETLKTYTNVAETRSLDAEEPTSDDIKKDTSEGDIQC